METHGNRAEAGSATIQQVVVNTTWKSLTEEDQNKLSKKFAEELGISIHRALDFLKLLKGPLLNRVIEEQTPKFHDPLPSTTKSNNFNFYLPRQFKVTYYKYEVRSTVFTEKDDIFVVSNIKIGQLFHWLQVQACMEQVEGSSYIFKVVDPSVRFFILECESHFEYICSHFRSRSVHLLKYTAEKLIWKESMGSISILKNHLITPTPVSIDSVTEQILVKNCTNTYVYYWGKSNRCICITGRQGMGKTQTLISFLKHVRVLSNRRARYINIKRIRKGTKTGQGNLATKICQTLCKNRLSRAYLEYDRSYFTDLFIDGLDDIFNSDEAVDIMKELQFMIPNVNFWITARPLLEERLKNHVAFVSFQIKPFIRSELIDCICKYLDQKAATLRGRKVSRPLVEKYVIFLKTECGDELVNVPYYAKILSRSLLKLIKEMNKQGSGQIEVESKFTSCIIAQVYFSLITQKLKRYIRRYPERDGERYSNEINKLFRELKYFAINSSQSLTGQTTPTFSTEQRLERLGLLANTETKFEKSVVAYLVAYKIVDIVSLRTELGMDTGKRILKHYLSFSHSTPNMATTNGFEDKDVAKFTDAILRLQTDIRIMSNAQLKTDLFGVEGINLKRFSLACMMEGCEHLFLKLASAYANEYPVVIYSTALLKTATEKCTSQFVISLYNKVEDISCLTKEDWKELLETAVDRGDYSIVRKLVTKDDIQKCLKEEPKFYHDIISKCQNGTNSKCTEKKEIYETLWNMRNNPGHQFRNTIRDMICYKLLHYL